LKYNDLVENSKSEDNILVQRGREYGVHHTILEQGGGLVDILSSQLCLDVEAIELLIWLGAVYINHERYLGDSSRQVKAQDYLRVHTSPRRYELPTTDPRQLIVFENHDFVVINKPSGLPVHALVDNNRENIISLFKERCQLDLKVTTRLDIPTSGLIVYAKTLDFQKRYNSYLRDNKIFKIYCAIAEVRSAKVLPQNLIHFMEPSLKAPKKISREPSEDSLRCELHILEQKNIADNLRQFRIQLLTGRTHQIRAQLSYEGFPILGDHHYGSRYLAHNDVDKIALQSQELSFPGNNKFVLSDFEWSSLFGMRTV
jgi:23S rRNA pseudouridine1911/1915/1917 synthase